MECIAIEKEGLELLRNKISEIEGLVNSFSPIPTIESQWIENGELSVILNLTIRTLQTHREKGRIGSSLIGKKVFYKIPEIIELIETNKITVDNKKQALETLKNHGINHN